MLRLDAERAVSFCDGLTRRDFLHAGAISMLGLSLADVFGQRASGQAPDRKIGFFLFAAAIWQEFQDVLVG